MKNDHQLEKNSWLLNKFSLSTPQEMYKRQLENLQTDVRVYISVLGFYMERSNLCMERSNLFDGAN